MRARVRWALGQELPAESEAPRAPFAPVSRSPTPGASGEPSPPGCVGDRRPPGEPCDARGQRGLLGRAQRWLRVAGAAFCRSPRPLPRNHRRSVAGVQRPVPGTGRGRAGAWICRTAEVRVQAGGRPGRRRGSGDPPRWALRGWKVTEQPPCTSWRGESRGPRGHGGEVGRAGLQNRVRPGWECLPGEAFSLPPVFFG